MPKKGPKVEWLGDDVFKATQRATELAANETMALCVDDAKKNVPVVTAVLQGSIRLTPALAVGFIVTGEWGSFDVNYALAVETGDQSLVGPPAMIPASYCRSPARARTTATRTSCGTPPTRNTLSSKIVSESTTRKWEGSSSPA